jgi:hypothetical protein
VLLNIASYLCSQRHDRQCVTLPSETWCRNVAYLLLATFDACLSSWGGHGVLKCLAGIHTRLLRYNRCSSIGENRQASGIRSVRAAQLRLGSLSEGGVETRFLRRHQSDLCDRCNRKAGNGTENTTD